MRHAQLRTCSAIAEGNNSEADHASKNDRKRRHHHLRAVRRSLCRRHLARSSISKCGRVHAQRGQPWPQKMRQSAVFDASVPSGPGPERMQPAAARGERRVARGGLAHSPWVDCRFSPFCTKCHVRGYVNVNMLVTLRQVNAYIQRVHMDGQMTCSSSAGVCALPPRLASENGIYSRHNTRVKVFTNRK